MTNEVVDEVANDRVMTWPEWHDAELDAEHQAKQWQAILVQLENKSLNAKLATANSVIIDMLIRESELKARAEKLEARVAELEALLAAALEQKP